MATYITTDDPKKIRTQQLYFLRKIYKTPYVSGVSGPTEKASSFLDHYAQPLVKRTWSYIKDSTAVIRLLEEKAFPQDVILATIDVRSLYLSIPHEEGMDAFTSHLYASGPLSQPQFPEEFTWSLLMAILKHNIFEQRQANQRNSNGD